MSKIDEKFKHDFINNSLRIEVINKVLCECLAESTKADEVYVKDLKQFLQYHLEYLEKL
jgi:hypothetical protein